MAKGTVFQGTLPGAGFKTGDFISRKSNVRIGKRDGAFASRNFTLFSSSVSCVELTQELV